MSRTPSNQKTKKAIFLEKGPLGDLDIEFVQPLQKVDLVNQARA